jgi:hypothetical protein
VLLSSFVFSVLVQAAVAAPLSLLEDGSHCVAYRAYKSMFLFSPWSEVVGKNCDISAQVLPDVGGLYRIEVTIPIKSFDSDSSTRDKDVAETLKADVKPELVFRSKGLTVDAWRELFAKRDFDLPGDLSIGDKSYPLKVKTHYTQAEDAAEVDGLAKVSFSDFEIAPPKVGGGLVAKSKPEFELHFHLLGSRILGADTIRLEKK